MRKRYPDLALIARAHARTDAYEYLAMGVPAVRETFGSALDAAEMALRSLGHRPVEARRVVTQFRQHDEALLVQQLPHRGEVKRLIALNQQGRVDLEQLLARELLAKVDEHDAAGDQQRGDGERPA